VAEAGSRAKGSLLSFFLLLEIFSFLLSFSKFVRVLWGFHGNQDGREA
jgi:hypothetical protein